MTPLVMQRSYLLWLSHNASILFAFLVAFTMAYHQAQLVNSPFEEGHFEIGITALNNLRSPDYKPLP